MIENENGILKETDNSSTIFDTISVFTFLICFAIVSVIIIANYGLVWGIILSILIVAIVIFYLAPFFKLGKLGGISRLMGYEDGKMVIDISDDEVHN